MGSIPKHFVRLGETTFEKYRHVVLNFVFFMVLGEMCVPQCAYRAWDHFVCLGKKLICQVAYKSSCCVFVLGEGELCVYHFVFVNNDSSRLSQLYI